MTGASSTVNRRAVYFVGGYDPKSPEAFFARMAKENARFETLWDVETRTSPVELSADGNIGTVGIISRGGQGASSWQTSTDFSFFVLDSLVLADFARPAPIRLGKYLVAFADFVLTGTAFRIFAKAWRFGLYFLFPFLMVMAFALAGYVAACLTAPWLGRASMLLGITVFAAALAILGKRWPVNHLMDLWSFSLNFFRGRRPDADALMRRFAETIVQDTRSEIYDEVLLVGHSTGGLLILDIAARCVTIDPEFAGRSSNVTILTLGSTALKAGLHPAAKDFRDGVKRIGENGKIHWVEIQCLTDVINFYKTNPVAEMGLIPRPDFPIVKRMRVKDMLESAAYKRIRRSFFRVHYQYIFGNTKRYWYDFFQICCGPVPLITRARHEISGDRPAQPKDQNNEA